MFYGLSLENKVKFLQALKSIAETYPGGMYAQDMLICVGKNIAFRSDEKFMASFDAHANSDQEKSLLWRLHVLAWAGLNALHVEGDFVECGVLRGFSSAVLCQFLEFDKLSREFLLYDTFSGLPEETSTEAERKNWDYTMLDSDKLYQEVCQIFSPYSNVNIIKGIVPQSFENTVPDKIAYLHIDMNSEAAEMMALDHLFDRVSPGGLIVLDDYGWISNVNQTIAESKFMQEHQHAILELPTGQGLILKH
ncbi:MAG: methyltransferase [Methylophaga sp.]|nr:MAG: methyltransferase [Methylophaga sp.]